MKETFERIEETYDGGPDLVCLSHLRWNFVYQRPQHLMSRCARERRVFYIEEPLFEPSRKRATLEIAATSCGVATVTPKLPTGMTQSRQLATQRTLMNQLVRKCAIHDCILWYYTPMALPFTEHLDPLLVVYDCMDELSGFRGAPPELRNKEAELMSRADVVFTGGLSLYEARARQHRNIHPFPSSIDAPHFARARDARETPADQRGIPHPRLGFAGVIDERMDLELVRGVAERRPDWHLVFLGPSVKVDPAELPRRANIHYLGPKSYEALPSYMAGWDVGIMPFAHNDSTRFISPTKTPEYLAAGRPVVSTSIRDVVRVYGARELVAIADTADDFVAEVDAILNRAPDPRWLDRVDRFLASASWDSTWSSMMRLIQDGMTARMETRSSEPPTWQSAPVGEQDV